MAIESIPPHPKPKVELEQYSTPSSIASDIMWNAYTLNDIYNKNIVDLACGTGIFSISSILLGAKKVIGVDIDNDSLEIALKTSLDMGISDDSSKESFIKFISQDLNKIDSLNQLSFIEGNEFEIDTLIQILLLDLKRSQKKVLIENL